jgi:steroid delta-isomerase-like uncharacterized protein
MSVDMGTASGVVQEYLGAFVRGDPDEISGFVATDFHNEHLSSIASGCVGREEYRRRLPGFLADFAGRSYSVQAVVEQDTGSSIDVVVRYNFRATFEGSAIDIPGVMWFAVEDGLIARRTDVWDSGTFFAQTAATEELPGG